MTGRKDHARIEHSNDDNHATKKQAGRETTGSRADPCSVDGPDEENEEQQGRAGETEFKRKGGKESYAPRSMNGWRYVNGISNKYKYGYNLELVPFSSSLFGGLSLFPPPFLRSKEQTSRHLIRDEDRTDIQQTSPDRRYSPC